MKQNIINLIKESCINKSKLRVLEDIYSLHDQLQYAENITEMAEFIFDWLKERYNVDNMNFALFDIEKNTSESILLKGDAFYPDDELSFYFIINTHTDLNAIVSFAVNTQEEFNYVNERYSNIEAAFFQISPIIQNGIINKLHIESSSLDSVTNVYNRKYLTKHINKMMSLSGKQNCTLSFLMVGIDHLKAVVDEFDYDVADQVLIELAKVIHSSIKEFDIVARLAGDEFLIVLVDAGGVDNAKSVAQQIIKKFAECEIDVGTHKLKKTVCVGISMYPKDTDDFNQSIKYADTFLYEAKNQGRSQYAVFTKEKQSSVDLF